MTALVQFEHVSKQYGSKKALDDVSFTLEPGALQALDQAGEAFIAAQLERGFRTLDYYKALLG